VLRDAGKDFDVTETIRELEEEMLQAANNLEFEKAALMRDQIRELKRGSGDGTMGPQSAGVSYAKSKRRGRGGKKMIGART
jgi:excinuclease ABC subunit B